MINHAKNRDIVVGSAITVAYIPPMNSIVSAWKAPPKEKVYEAISAILDDRVTEDRPGSASVFSSNRSKYYTVTWDPERTAFGSNDNASYFQGYMGYPIIAALFHLKMLEFDHELFGWLRGVPWKAVNTKHKNNYAKAVAAVMEEKVPDEQSRTAVLAAVDRIYEELLALEVGRLKTIGRPPK